MCAGPADPSRTSSPLMTVRADRISRRFNVQMGPGFTLRAIATSCARSRNHRDSENQSLLMELEVGRAGEQMQGVGEIKNEVAENTAWQRRVAIRKDCSEQIVVSMGTTSLKFDSYAPIW